MNDSSSPETTKVVGYFNGKAWPVHLAVSEFNLTLQLQPGDFIIDKKGNKINDPFFERYAGQLSREVADNPVAVRRIPRAAQAPIVRDGHAVREVTQFTVDSRGHKTPVIPAAVPVSTPGNTSFNPVHGMTLEEARRLRFVKPTRLVPEDYGASESDGAPAHGGGIPEIKYATDTVRSKPAPLPKELVQLGPKEVEKLTPAQVALAESLAKAAAAPAAASADADDGGFGNVVVDTQVAPAPAVAQPAHEVLPEPEASVELMSGVPLDVELPEPALSELEPAAVEPAAVEPVMPASDAPKKAASKPVAPPPPRSALRARLARGE